VSASRGSRCGSSTVCSSSAAERREQLVPVDPCAEHLAVGPLFSRRRSGWNATAATTVISTAASTGTWAPNARPGAAVTAM
jgi:hypothetical protein